MKDEDRTKGQLIKELAKLRERCAELQAAETKHKQAESAVRESEEKFRTLADQSPNMIFINKKGRVVYANSRSEEVMGYTRQEFYGPDFDFLRLIAPESVEIAKSSFATHVKGGEVEPCEYTLITKKGKRIEAIINTRLINYEGETAILGTVTDITERKWVEETLRESEEKYRTLVEYSLQGLNILQGFPPRIIFANSSVAEIYGYTVDEFLSLSPEERMALVHPEDREFVWGRYRDRLSGKKILARYEFRVIRKDGTVRWVEVFSSRIEYHGEPAVQAVLVDITERKRAEHALLERERELEIKTANLEEVNTALRVLLKRREQDKTELEEKVLFNMKELVMPYVERLKRSGLDERQKGCVSILESNLDDIVSPFSSRLSSLYLNFTPAEMQVANLVRYGKATKEIAELLNVSTQTIDSHRKNIRRKMGIRNRKANLRTHLLSMQK